MAPLPLLNVVAGVVYALAMPFVALTTAQYGVHFDVRVRQELEPAAPATLPAGKPAAGLASDRANRVAERESNATVHMAQYGIA